MRAELSLGTAQFGMDYGVTHGGGPMSNEEVASILLEARLLGVNWLDTAAAYGSAEERVGGSATSRSFRVCTKIDGETAPQLDHALKASLARLKRDRTDILLFHNVGRLQGENAAEAICWMAEQAKIGLTTGWGVSLYDPHELDAALDAGVDWIQIPVSILDQAWITSGAIERALAAGVQIQVRSSLAQGLIAANPAELPEVLRGLGVPIKRLNEAATAMRATPVDLALAFAGQLPVDQVVVGVQNVEQLRDCAAAFATVTDCAWASFDAGCRIDPRRWPAGLKVLA